MPSPLSNEQKELIDDYLCELNRKGEFHTVSGRQKAANILEKYGKELINPETKKPFVERTIRQYIYDFIDGWMEDGSAFKRGIKKKMMFAADKMADQAAKNPQAFKVLADKVIPNKPNDATDNRPALSPLAVAILQRPGVETTLIIGQGSLTEGVGHQGHKCSDTDDFMAPERGGDIRPEAIPPGDDTPIHGVHQGGDTAEGTTVPDTEGPPKDPVDIDGGADMGSIE